MREAAVLMIKRELKCVCEVLRDEPRRRFSLLQDGEFSLLRRRLENLESAQQQQLEELGSLVQKDRDSAPHADL